MKKMMRVLSTAALVSMLAGTMAVPVLAEGNSTPVIPTDGFIGLSGSVETPTPLNSTLSFPIGKRIDFAENLVLPTKDNFQFKIEGCGLKTDGSKYTYKDYKLNDDKTKYIVNNVIEIENSVASDGSPLYVTGDNLKTSEIDGKNVYYVETSFDSTPGNTFESTSIDGAFNRKKLAFKSDYKAVIPFDFSDAPAGVYHYKVTEIAGTTPGMYYDVASDEATVYDLFAFVIIDDDNVSKVKYVVKASDDSKTSDVVFDNEYKEDENGDEPDNPDSTVHSIYIEKAIDGNMAETNPGPFKFEISIKGHDDVDASEAKEDNPEYHEKYKVITTGSIVEGQYENLSTDKKKADFVSGTTTVDGKIVDKKIIVAIKPGENIRITGVSSADEVSVKECADEAERGYFVSEYVIAEYSGVDPETGEKTYDAVEGGSFTVTPHQEKINEGIVIDSDNETADDDDVFTTTKETKITVTNKRDSSIAPTGVITTFAPYAMMVAAAGALSAFFFGKKRREEF